MSQAFRYVAKGRINLNMCFFVFLCGRENRIFARTRGRELREQDRGHSLMDVDVPVHLVA